MNETTTPITTQAFTTSNIIPVTTGNGGESGHSTDSGGEGSHISSTSGEGSHMSSTSSSRTTTGSSTSYNSFTDNTGQRDREPSGYCSLLLQVECETTKAIVLEDALFSIFRESWMVIAEVASYFSTSVGLYVEFVAFHVLNQNRRLMMNDLRTFGDLSDLNDTAITVTNATAKTTYDYYYNFSVALFDGTECDTWYSFFATYGSSFISEYGSYLLLKSENFTSDTLGFGEISMISVTLSERSSTGSIIASTTFSTTSSGNNYNVKYIMFIFGTLSIVCFTWLL